MSRPRRRVIALFLSLVLAGSTRLGADSIDETRTHRLAALGRLWAAVEVFHPWLSSRDIDWDAPLIRAIPAVRSARSTHEYAAAVSAMLAALDDPVTRLVDASGHVDVDSHPNPHEALYRILDDGTLIVEAGRFASTAGVWQLHQELQRSLDGEIRNRRAVVFDLRTSSSFREHEALGWVIDSSADAVTPAPVTAPSQRYIVYWGWTPDTSNADGGGAAFVSNFGRTFGSGGIEAERRTVFIVNDRRTLPSVAVAMQCSNLARIISENIDLGDDSLVEVLTIDLGEGLRADVRVSELVPGGGFTSLRADAIVATPSAESYDQTLAAAIRYLERPFGPREDSHPTALALPPGRARLTRSYPSTSEPSIEYRLLGAFRFWSTIHYFYPYADLVGDWDRVLEQLLPEFEGADNERDYILAILRISSLVGDSQASIRADSTLAASVLGGTAGPGLVLRLIDDRYVITEVAADSASEAREGDVIIAIDGIPIEKKVSGILPLVPGSRMITRRAHAAERAMRGEPGSTITLRVENSSGVGEVNLLRNGEDPNEERTDARKPWSTLDGGIGYVDVRRLQPADVSRMFDELRKTRGMIFDLRGELRAPAWTIAPRINTRGAKTGAIFRRPEVSAMTIRKGLRSGYSFEQPLPPSISWIYEKPTATLIDERTTGHAEHAALLFEAANDTTFIGSRTAGATGDVATIVLPGGIEVTFTSNEVRHADGRPLQYIGIVPHIEVEPTIEGIRQNRDEVLTRAVEYLRSGS